MICGAVSTVTVYLTWFWRLRSLPALTSSLTVAGSCLFTANMAAVSPFCGEMRKRKTTIMSAGYHEESEMRMEHRTKKWILTQVETRESVKKLAYPA